MILLAKKVEEPQRCYKGANDKMKLMKEDDKKKHQQQNTSNTKIPYGEENVRIFSKAPLSITRKQRRENKKKTEKS